MRRCKDYAAHYPKWDDWRWQVANRITTADGIAGFLGMTEAEKDDVEQCLSAFRMALAIIIVYLLALLFTSWYSTRLQKQGSSKEFLFADQKLGTLLVGVTIAGLAIGGTSTTGVAQNAFTAGISAAWYDVA